VPDWFWQGLAVWAVVKGIEWTWKHRNQVMRTLTKQPIIKRSAVHIQGTSSLTARPIKRTVTDQLGLSDDVQPVLLSGSIGGKGTFTGELTVGSPSLTKRLTDEGLELVSWYVRQR
jgi:hypothetical protein